MVDLSNEERLIQEFLNTNENGRFAETELDQTTHILKETYKKIQENKCSNSLKMRINLINEIVILQRDVNNEKKITEIDKDKTLKDLEDVILNLKELLQQVDSDVDSLGFNDREMNAISELDVSSLLEETINIHGLILNILHGFEIALTHSQVTTNILEELIDIRKRVVDKLKVLYKMKFQNSETRIVNDENHIASDKDGITVDLVVYSARWKENVNVISDMLMNICSDADQMIANNRHSDNSDEHDPVMDMEKINSRLDHLIFCISNNIIVNFQDEFASLRDSLSTVEATSIFNESDINCQVRDAKEKLTKLHNLMKNANTDISFQEALHIKADAITMESTKNFVGNIQKQCQYLNDDDTFIRVIRDTEGMVSSKGFQEKDIRGDNLTQFYKYLSDIMKLYVCNVAFYEVKDHISIEMDNIKSAMLELLKTESLVQSPESISEKKSFSDKTSYETEINSSPSSISECFKTIVAIEEICEMSSFLKDKICCIKNKISDFSLDDDHLMNLRFKGYWWIKISELYLKQYRSVILSHSLEGLIKVVDIDDIDEKIINNHYLGKEIKQRCWLTIVTEWQSRASIQTEEDFNKGSKGTLSPEWSKFQNNMHLILEFNEMFSRMLKSNAEINEACMDDIISCRLKMTESNKYFIKKMLTDQKSVYKILKFVNCEMHDLTNQKSIDIESLESIEEVLRNNRISLEMLEYMYLLLNKVDEMYSDMPIVVDLVRKEIIAINNIKEGLLTKNDLFEKVRIKLETISIKIDQQFNLLNLIQAFLDQELNYKLVDFVLEMINRCNKTMDEVDTNVRDISKNIEAISNEEANQHLMKVVDVTRIRLSEINEKAANISKELLKFKQFISTIISENGLIKSLKTDLRMYLLKLDIFANLKVESIMSSETCQNCITYVDNLIKESKIYRDIINKIDIIYHKIIERNPSAHCISQKSLFYSEIQNFNNSFQVHQRLVEIRNDLMLRSDFIVKFKSNCQALGGSIENIKRFLHREPFNHDMDISEEFSNINSNINTFLAFIDEDNTHLDQVQKEIFISELKDLLDIYGHLVNQLLKKDSTITNSILNKKNEKSNISAAIGDLDSSTDTSWNYYNIAKNCAELMETTEYLLFKAILIKAHILDHIDEIYIPNLEKSEEYLNFQKSIYSIEVYITNYQFRTTQFLISRYELSSNFEELLFEIYSRWYHKIKILLDDKKPSYINDICTIETLKVINDTWINFLNKCTHLKWFPKEHSKVTAFQSNLDRLSSILNDVNLLNLKLCAKIANFRILNIFLMDSTEIFKFSLKDKTRNHSTKFTKLIEQHISRYNLCEKLYESILKEDMVGPDLTDDIRRKFLKLKEDMGTLNDMNSLTFCNQNILNFENNADMKISVVIGEEMKIMMEYLYNILEFQRRNRLKEEIFVDRIEIIVKLLDSDCERQLANTIQCIMYPASINQTIAVVKSCITLGQMIVVHQNTLYNSFFKDACSLYKDYETISNDIIRFADEINNLYFSSTMYPIEKFEALYKADVHWKEIHKGTSTWYLRFDDIRSVMDTPCTVNLDQVRSKLEKLVQNTSFIFDKVYNSCEEFRAVFTELRDKQHKTYIYMNVAQRCDIYLRNILSRYHKYNAADLRSCLQLSETLMEQFIVVNEQIKELDELKCKLRELMFGQSSYAEEIISSCDGKTVDINGLMELIMSSQCAIKNKLLTIIDSESDQRSHMVASYSCYEDEPDCLDKNVWSSGKVDSYKSINKNSAVNKAESKDIEDFVPNSTLEGKVKNKLDELTKVYDNLITVIDVEEHFLNENLDKIRRNIMKDEPSDQLDVDDNCENSCYSRLVDVQSCFYDKTDNSSQTFEDYEKCSNLSVVQSSNNEYCANDSHSFERISLHSSTNSLQYSDNIIINDTLNIGSTSKGVENLFENSNEAILSGDKNVDKIQNLDICVSKEFEQKNIHSVSLTIMPTEDEVCITIKQSDDAGRINEETIEEWVDTMPHLLSQRIKVNSGVIDETESSSTKVQYYEKKDSYDPLEMNKDSDDIFRIDHESLNTKKQIGVTISRRFVVVEDIEYRENNGKPVSLTTDRTVTKSIINYQTETTIREDDDEIELTVRRVDNHSIDDTDIPSAENISKNSSWYIAGRDFDNVTLVNKEGPSVNIGSNSDENYNVSVQIMEDDKKIEVGGANLNESVIERMNEELKDDELEGSSYITKISIGNHDQLINMRENSLLLTSSKELPSYITINVDGSKLPSTDKGTSDVIDCEGIDECCINTQVIFETFKTPSSIRCDSEVNSPLLCLSKPTDDIEECDDIEMKMALNDSILEVPQQYKKGVLLFESKDQSCYDHEEDLMQRSETCDKSLEEANSDVIDDDDMKGKLLLINSHQVTLKLQSQGDRECRQMNKTCSEEFSRQMEDVDFLNNECIADITEDEIRGERKVENRQLCTRDDTITCDNVDLENEKEIDIGMKEALPITVLTKNIHEFENLKFIERSIKIHSTNDSDEVPEEQKISEKFDVISDESNLGSVHQGSNGALITGGIKTTTGSVIEENTLSVDYKPESEPKVVEDEGNERCKRSYNFEEKHIENYSLFSYDKERTKNDPYIPEDVNKTDKEINISERVDRHGDMDVNEDGNATVNIERDYILDSNIGNDNQSGLEDYRKQNLFFETVCADTTEDIKKIGKGFIKSNCTDVREDGPCTEESTNKEYNESSIIKQDVENYETFSREPFKINFSESAHGSQSGQDRFESNQKRNNSVTTTDLITEKSHEEIRNLDKDILSSVVRDKITEDVEQCTAESRINENIADISITKDRDFSSSEVDIQQGSLESGVCKQTDNLSNICNVNTVEAMEVEKTIRNVSFSSNDIDVVSERGMNAVNLPIHGNDDATSQVREENKNESETMKESQSFLMNINENMHITTIQQDGGGNCDEGQNTAGNMPHNFEANEIESKGECLNIGTSVAIELVKTTIRCSPPTFVPNEYNDLNGNGRDILNTEILIEESDDQCREKDREEQHGYMSEASESTEVQKSLSNSLCHQGIIESNDNDNIDNTDRSLFSEEHEEASKVIESKDEKILLQDDGSKEVKVEHILTTECVNEMLEKNGNMVMDSSDDLINRDEYSQDSKVQDDVNRHATHDSIRMRSCDSLNADLGDSGEISNLRIMNETEICGDLDDKSAMAKDVAEDNNCQNKAEDVDIGTNDHVRKSDDRRSLKYEFEESTDISVEGALVNIKAQESLVQPNWMNYDDRCEKVFDKIHTDTEHDQVNINLVSALHIKDDTDENTDVRHLLVDVGKDIAIHGDKCRIEEHLLTKDEKVAFTMNFDKGCNEEEHCHKGSLSISSVGTLSANITEMKDLEIVKSSVNKDVESKDSNEEEPCHKGSLSISSVGTLSVNITEMKDLEIVKSSVNENVESDVDVSKDLSHASINVDFQCNDGICERSTSVMVSVFNTGNDRNTYIDEKREECTQHKDSIGEYCYNMDERSRHSDEGEGRVSIVGFPGEKNVLGVMDENVNAIKRTLGDSINQKGDLHTFKFPNTINKDIHEIVPEGSETDIIDEYKSCITDGCDKVSNSKEEEDLEHCSIKPNVFGEEVKILNNDTMDDGVISDHFEKGKEFGMESRSSDYDENQNIVDPRGPCVEGKRRHSLGCFELERSTECLNKISVESDVEDIIKDKDIKERDREIKRYDSLLEKETDVIEGEQHTLASETIDTNIGRVARGVDEECKGDMKVNNDILEVFDSQNDENYYTRDGSLIQDESFKRDIIMSTNCKTSGNVEDVEHETHEYSNEKIDTRDDIFDADKGCVHNRVISPTDKGHAYNDIDPETQTECVEKKDCDDLGPLVTHLSNQDITGNKQVTSESSKCFINEFDDGSTDIIGRISNKNDIQSVHQEGSSVDSDSIGNESSNESQINPFCDNTIDNKHVRNYSIKRYIEGDERVDRKYCEGIVDLAIGMSIPCMASLKPSESVIDDAHIQRRERQNDDNEVDSLHRSFKDERIVEKEVDVEEEFDGNLTDNTLSIRSESETGNDSDNHCSGNQEDDGVQEMLWEPRLYEQYQFEIQSESIEHSTKERQNIRTDPSIGDTKITQRTEESRKVETVTTVTTQERLGRFQSKRGCSCWKLFFISFLLALLIILLLSTNLHTLYTCDSYYIQMLKNINPFSIQRYAPV